MLARRIIAVSPEKAFGKQLATALKAAGGAVDTHQTLDSLGGGDLQAALCVMHLDGDLAGASAEILPRLTGECRVIAILPRSNLAAVVDIMQASDRVAGMMVAEDFDSRQLSAMATRILAGDIFGLEKLVLWGTQIHSQLVGDYQEKSLCISQISEFAEVMGVRRKYRESIEQCLDEMLMNALYDAPVDEQGEQIFSEIPTKTRISLRVEQKVVVQYACDGKQFALTVRDAFGTLERSTVLRYLHKCLHNEQQIDRKAGGAGLGLYMIVNSSTVVYFNVLPGVATEAACVFDLETPKLQLEQFGFFMERIDAAGRLASGPSRRLPAGTPHPVERRARTQAAPPPRGIVFALSAAILLLFGLITIAAWPRLMGGTHKTHVTFSTIPKGATIEIEGRNAGTATEGTLAVGDLEIGRAYPVVARLDGYEAKQAVVQPHDGANQVTFELQALAATVVLDSQPTGARVEIGGKSVGETPLTLTNLTPGTAVAVSFKRAGYHDALARLEVPGPGKEMRLVQPLAVSDDFARVRFVSDPPGAQIVQNGQLIAGVTTPAEVLVEPSKLQHFMLTLPHHVPYVIEPFTPARGSDGVEKSGKLVEGVTLHIESNLEGKVKVSGAPHCTDLALPADCVLAAGSYIVDLIGAGGAKATHTVK
ncbi:MAG: hypothetical protein JWO36_2894, partial [Myxococcales bacterium]|nr:hypothetical protein [Myxococcales bacterium]